MFETRVEHDLPSCVLLDLDNTLYAYEPAHQAGLLAAQLAAEQTIIEKGECPIQRGVGFCSRIGGGHSGLFVSYETTIAHFKPICKHDYMIT